VPTAELRGQVDELHWRQSEYAQESDTELVSRHRWESLEWVTFPE
jgi:hypothetical protein